MPNKFDALKKLVNKEAKSEIQGAINEQVAPKDQSLFDKGMDYLDRPAASTRAAVSALQNDVDPIEAFKKQLFQPSKMAPTGSDIAEKAGEQLDIQNPYALTALSTIAELGLDPTMLIPGGQFKKGASVLGKMAKNAPEAAKVVKEIPGMTKNSDEAIKALKEMMSKPKGEFGRVAVIPDKQAINMPIPVSKQPTSNIPEVFRASTAKQELGDDAFRAIREQFPQAQDVALKVTKKK